jgi:hypothetical protein
MVYHYVLYLPDQTPVPSRETYGTAQIALNHGKYFLAHAKEAVRVVVIDSEGRELLSYDKPEGKRQPKVYTWVRYTVSGRDRSYQGFDTPTAALQQCLEASGDLSGMRRIEIVDVFDYHTVETHIYNEGGK